MIKKYAKDLTSKMVEIIITENAQRGKIHEDAWRVTYAGEDIKSIDIISGAEAAEFETHIDGSSIDDRHRYIVLNLADGGEATFRASHTNIYIF